MLLYLSGTQGHSAGRDGPLCPSPKFPPHSINNKTQCGWPERRNWNSLLMLLRCSKAHFQCPLLPLIAWVRWFFCCSHWCRLILCSITGQIQSCYRSCVCWLTGLLNGTKPCIFSISPAVSYQCGFHLRHWTQPPPPPQKKPSKFLCSLFNQPKLNSCSSFPINVRSCSILHVSNWLAQLWTVLPFSSTHVSPHGVTLAQLGQSDAVVW